MQYFKGMWTPIKRFFSFTDILSMFDFYLNNKINRNSPRQKTGNSIIIFLNISFEFYHKLYIGSAINFASSFDVKWREMACIHIYFTIYIYMYIIFYIYSLICTICMMFYIYDDVMFFSNHFGSVCCQWGVWWSVCHAYH